MHILKINRKKEAFDIKTGKPYIRIIMAIFAFLLVFGSHDTVSASSRGKLLNGAQTRQARGSNYWPTTNLREWLNSDRQNVGYTNLPPVSYANEPGFLTNFTTTERNAILVTRHRVIVSGADANQIGAPGGVRPYGNGALFSPYINYSLPGIVKDYKNYNHVKINDKVFTASPYELLLYMQQRGFSLAKEPTQAMITRGDTPIGQYWMSGGESYNGGETTYTVEADGKRGVRNGDSAYTAKGVVPLMHVNGNYRFDNGQLGKNLSIGSVVTFGRYLGEKIEWRVVNQTNGNPLLISEKIIDVKAQDAPGDLAYQHSSYINFASHNVDITEYPFTPLRNNDTQKPDLEILNMSQLDTRQNSGFTLNFRASDAHGIDRIYLPNGAMITNTNFSYSFPNNGTYNFIIVDRSGNYRNYVLPIGNINVPYRMRATANPTEWTRNNVSVDVRATNEGVGSSRGSLTQSNRDTYLSDGWPDYSTFMGKRIRIRGSVEYVSSTMSDINNRRVNIGFRYNYIDYDGEEWNKRGNWHTAHSWPLREVRDKGKITFDVTTTVPNSFFEQLRPWVSINMSASNNGAHTVRWTNLSFELLDTNDYVIDKIILPDGRTINSSSYTDTLTTAGTYTYTAIDGRGMALSDTVVAKIDRTAPTGTISQTSNGWINTGNLLILNAQDSQSGVRRIQLPDGTWTNNATAMYTAESSGTYSFVMEDKVGNSRTISTTVTNIDKMPPNGDISGSPTIWTNNDVTLRFNGTDSGGSGVKRVQRPNGTWVNGSTASHTVSENGTYTFRVEDNAGNFRDVSVVVNRIDKTLPNGTITGNPTAWTNKNVTLVFSATDSGGSGVKRIRLPNGTWVNGSTASQSITENGTYTFRVEDNAGNIRDVSTTVNRIDKSIPSGLVTQSPTAWTNGNVTLTFSATDTGGSGVRRVRQSGGTWISGPTTTLTVSNNGTYQFEVEDVAGNSKIISYEVTNIDKTLPNGTISGNPTNWTNQSQTITLTATDSGGSGVRRIRLPDGRWVNGSTASHVIPSNGTYSFVVEDNAGNQRTITANVTKIDKLSPDGSFTGNPTNWTNQDITLRFTGTDTGGSGIKRIRRPSGTWVSGHIATEVIKSNGTYTFRVEDNAGNYKDVSMTVDRIDKVSPSENIIKIKVK